MSLEDQLAGWTGPSSDTEQEKQERTERMIREAINAHSAFSGYSLSAYAKGSYANNTNVRADSDVDIAVQCHEVQYWEEAAPGAHPPSQAYSGIWTPAKLRTELGTALVTKFGSQVTSGDTAFHTRSTSARVEAHVVPCFNYRYYFAGGGSRAGTKIYNVNGGSLVNYPAQHLENGRSKNTATNGVFKRAVRILKRGENAMVNAGVATETPSYLIECLAFNCPNPVFTGATWTQVIRSILIHVYNSLEGEEPAQEGKRWLEVNRGKFLFSPSQKWTRTQARQFAADLWSHLGFS